TSRGRPELEGLLERGWPRRGLRAFGMHGRVPAAPEEHRFGAAPETRRAARRRLSCTMFRQRPTLPPGYPGSTIGAGGLNFRVRDGTGCLPSAMATETMA